MMGERLDFYLLRIAELMRTECRQEGDRYILPEPAYQNLLHCFSRAEEELQADDAIDPARKDELRSNLKVIERVIAAADLKPE